MPIDKKVVGIVSSAQSINALRENYMNSLIRSQERGLGNGHAICEEAQVAAVFEIAIQLAKLNESLDRFSFDDKGRVQVFVDGV